MIMRLPEILLSIGAIICAPVSLLLAISEPDAVIYPDGRRYSGAFHGACFHGRGRLVLPDGSEYRGWFNSGLPHGKGIYLHPDGRRSAVEHDEGKLMEGRIISNDILLDGARFGSFTQNGSYTGWFRGDRVRGYVPHGRGIMKYDNGSVYSGQWYEGKMHGNGSMQWEDGSRYCGNWVHGKREGFGSYAWPRGDRYVGGWKDNRMYGKGTYRYRDGRTVKGFWRDTTVMAWGD
jgi:hypothetical protein